MNVIVKRQQYFRLGQDYEANEEWVKAIDAYKQYSSFLGIGDKHIPHFRIAELYDKLGDNTNAIIHLKEYSKGCTPAKRKSIEEDIRKREGK